MRPSSSSSRRGAGGGFSSVSGSGKPLVLLYFSGHDTAEIGYASFSATAAAAGVDSSSSNSPRHVAALPPLRHSAKSARDAQLIFLRYAPPLADLFARLLGAGTKQQRHRRAVVVLHSQGLYVNRWWRLAVCRVLRNVVQIASEQQHVAFVSTLQVVPAALWLLPPLKSNTTSNTSASTTTTSCCCLTVCLTATEAQCMVCAMGHCLEYTYQSCGYDSLWDDHDSNSPAPPRTVRELQSRQRKLLQKSSNNSNNMQHLLLLRALCQSLEQCPVALRRAAIHNIVVAGTVVVHNFGVQLARALYQFLDDDSSDATKEETKQDSKSETDVTTAAAASSVVWTGVPINKTALRPLREHIAVLEFDFGGGVAPSALPWTAASLWALQQQQQQQHATKPTGGPAAAAAAAAASTTTVPTAWNELASEIEL